MSARKDKVNFVKDSYRRISTDRKAEAFGWAVNEAAALT
jgi:hypothetical protein